MMIETITNTLDEPNISKAVTIFTQRIKKGVLQAMLRQDCECPVAGGRDLPFSFARTHIPSEVVV